MFDLIIFHKLDTWKGTTIETGIISGRGFQSVSINCISASTFSEREVILNVRNVPVYVYPVVTVV